MHSRYMQIALALARRNLGQTWPNPSVGALLVKDGHIIGQGVTQRGGRPHAETQAIAQAGAEARGATLYVTLEPCAHQGQTRPCTQAIIEAGITACVIACRDPNPLVNGRGIAQLRAADIEVIENISHAEALEANRGFFSVIEKKRPYIALKIAGSLDGKIARPPGGPRWITGERARAYGHGLRSRYDAIATGIGTVLADDPLLTCRLPGLEDRSPVRVLFDRALRLPPDSQLAQTANEVPLWIFHSSPCRGEAGRGLVQHSEQVDLPLPQPSPLQGEGVKSFHHDSLENAVCQLATLGITRLLIEAGQALSSAFLQSGLVDRIYWFRAPLAIGEGGLDALSGGLADWRVMEHSALFPDSLDILECSPAS